MRNDAERNDSEIVAVIQPREPVPNVGGVPVYFRDLSPTERARLGLFGGLVLERDFLVARERALIEAVDRFTASVDTADVPPTWDADTQAAFDAMRAALVRAMAPTPTRGVEKP